MSFYVVEKWTKDSFGFHSSLSMKKIKDNGEIGFIMKDIFAYDDYIQLGPHAPHKGVPLIDAYPKYFL